MAFGLNSKYKQSKTIEGLTQEQLIVLCVDAINALNWNTSYISSNKIIAYTANNVFATNQEITININQSTLDVTSKSIGGELFDWSINKKNIARFFNKLDYLKEKTEVEQLNLKFVELQLSLEQPENEQLSKEPETFKEKLVNMFSLFVPKEGYYITPILLNLNILIFILMLLSGAGFIIPNNEVLLSWGGNFKPLTLDGGQWWRLFTCIFIHAGVLHLVMNMYALLYIGLLLEPYLGKLRFSVFYILTGLLASTTSLYWHELSVCVGASGAIFGLYGIFLAMLFTNLIEKNARKAFLTSISIFVIYNLLNGMKGNIDNAAHLGGLLTGMLIGFGSYFSLKWDNNLRIKLITVSLSSVVVLLAIFTALMQTPKVFAEYDKKMNEFAQLEIQALELYKLKTENKQKISTQLNNGLATWNQCIVLLDSVDKLNIPIELKVRVNKLREYVNLRIEAYHIINEGLLNDSLDEKLLNEKNNKIDSLIRVLQNQ